MIYLLVNIVSVNTIQLKTIGMEWRQTWEYEFSEVEIETKFKFSEISENLK